MKRTVLGLLLFLAATFMLAGCGLNTTTTKDVTTGLQILGSVTVQIYTNGDNPDTQEVETEYVSEEKTIDFHQTDNLFTLVFQNFNVACQAEDGSSDDLCSYVSQYGHYLLKIDTLQVTANNEYIALYQDGSYATAGIDTLPLVDGSVYQFKLETF